MCPAIGATGRASRWCPTAEQVMLLEELYKGGLTNPGAGQIHQIVAHLSQFGKVQGKNVFYWFQNHKARDKQKIRKKLVRHNQQLVGLQMVQCSNSPIRMADSCCKPKLTFHSYSKSVSPFSNDESLVTLPVTGLGDITKPHTNASSYGVLGIILDSRRSSGHAMPIQEPLSCDRRRPSLVTLDLFPVTPMIMEVEGSKKQSHSYTRATNTPQLLPKPYLTLGTRT